ncbi:hypothetical protein [Mesorhizobium sp. IMUNJ 23232]|uniref:hypothetical protein n=1 Tax=Mesorhizobium sp. IMUNJ 23232 TaxID=3376064 RepID=UPI0037BD6E27
MSSTILTDLALKQMQQFDGTEFAASIEPRHPQEPEAPPSQGVQMQQQPGVAGSAATARVTGHADVVREVERSLRFLGASEAEIAALNTTDPQSMYDALQRAGGKSDILSIIGSYRDTLSDDEVLERLQHWNTAEFFTRREEPARALP